MSSQSEGKKGLGLTCQVCDERPAIGVACSPLGPVSYAYCRECLGAGADNYGMVVTTTALCGGYEKHQMAPHAREIVRATLAHLSVSGEQFDKDVAQAMEELEEMP